MQSTEKCSVDGCGGARRSRGWCNKHYLRWKKYGDVDVVVQKRTPNVGLCEVDGCDSPQRKLTWCAAHYAQWRDYGEAKPFIYKWAEVGSPCVVCGAKVEPGSGRRKYCSSGCQVTNLRHKGARPKVATCILCKRTFSLTRRDDAGRLQRVDTLWCRSCGRDSPDAQRYKKYGVTPQQFAAALESGCAICGVMTDDLHVDHDHSCCTSRYRNCGKCTRGFLCGPCNRGIGMFKDDAAIVRRASEYLFEWAGE